VGIADRGLSLGRRLVGLAVLLPILLAVQYTASRGALVGLAVIVVVFSLQRFGLGRGAPLAAVGLVVLLLWGPGRTLEPAADEGPEPVPVAAAVPDTAAPIDQLVPRDTSALGRVDAWAKGLAMLAAHPLFGVGYSRFTDYNELVAHNSFVHIFAELGLLGAFFGAGMAYWYFAGLRAPPGEVPGGRRARALVLSGIGFFTMACFLSRQYDLVLYTLLGLGACHAALTRDADPDRPLATTLKDLRNIALVTAGGVVTMTLVVRALTRWSGG
jgi:O-antigen ligase